MTQQAMTIGISKLNSVVIKDLTMINSVTDLAATHALGSDWVVIHQPVSDVEIVDVLLNDMIATNPIKVIPVIHLVLQLSLAVDARPSPNSASVPVDARMDQVTNDAVLKLVNGFSIGSLMSAL
jgi:hypothetical protein